MAVHKGWVVVLLLLGVYQGEAQELLCYSHDKCEVGGDPTYTGLPVQDCCRMENGVTFQTDRGEQCFTCLIYGWRETFPINVTKGQELTLTVGYNKGRPNVRRGFRVLYDENEVNVSVDDFVLLIDVQEVNVTILDDGEPVANDTIITLTLEQYGSVAGIADVVLKTATLIIRADEVPTTPVVVSLERTEIIVSEEVGMVDVCVSAVDAGSTVISVSMTDNPGNTNQGDYVFTPTTLGLSANQNRLCRVVEVPLDGVYEDNEIFYIQLSTSDDNVRIVQNETRITIEDSDEALVYVDPYQHIVKEGSDELMRICLYLNNSEVSIDFQRNVAGNSTIDLLQDLDTLQAPPHTLDPSGAQSCYEFRVIDDDLIEGNEILYFEWDTSAPRVTFEPPVYSLIIEDNDFMPSPSPTPSPSPLPSPPPSSSSPPIISISPSPLPSASPSPLPPLPPVPTPPYQSFVDVISGGALLAVPINTQSSDSELPDMALCYEIHGKEHTYFNLISNPCISVNAHYSLYAGPRNTIDQVAIVAKNSNGESVNITIDGDCNLNEGQAPSVNLRYINSSGVMAVATPKQVVVWTDNSYCSKPAMYLWIQCVGNDDSIRYTDVNDIFVLSVYHDPEMTNDSSHGLLGQFWGVPISVEHYRQRSSGYYLIEIPGTPTRDLVGDGHSRTWRLKKQECIYVGDRQGAKGAGLHGGPNDPVIEGVYTDYITDGPFDTNFMFSQFGK